MPHEAQKKSKPFFSLITLKPAGALSTRVINQSSSTAESWASPVFRQIGHRRISTQWSRSIPKYAPQSRNVPYVVKAALRKNQKGPRLRKTKRPQGWGGHMLGPPSDAN